MNKKKIIFLSLLIIAAGAAITALIFQTEPEARRTGAAKKTAMLVKTVGLERGTYHPEIMATGNVRAARDIMLSPRVTGQVTDISKKFIPGGRVEKGELLVQIDPADFRNNLALRKSELEQARADLAIEKGLQDVARQDFQLIEGEVDTQNNDLVLRKPQLNSVKARVQSAEASLQQAQLNLQRTSIRAPFNAHIITRNANVGSQIAPGVNIGRLVGRDEYWVVTSVPLRNLPWIALPQGDTATGARARISDRKSWKPGQHRMGQVSQLIGTLSDQTRMARLLIAVPDPLGERSDTLPRLMLNSFVEVAIRAKAVRNSIRLKRDYVRENNTVWTMEDGKLKIKTVEILFRDARYVYIQNGLEESDEVVTTDLSTVAEGARLRTERASAAQESSSR